MNPNRPELSLIIRPASEPAATPMPATVRTGRATPPVRPGNRCTGAARPAAIAAADPKFITNSVPMTGTTEYESTKNCARWSTPTPSRASAPTYRAHVATVCDPGLTSPRRASVIVDLLSARREDVPLGAELVESLAARVARLRVAGVGVKRVAGVGRLGLAIRALDRPELGGRDAVPGRPRGGGRRRPDTGAGAVAGAGRTLVLLEQVQRPAVAVCEDPPELGRQDLDGHGRRRGLCRCSLRVHAAA